MQNEAEYGDLSALLRFDEPKPRPAPQHDPRLLTIFRVGKLTTDRFEELCLIRNVGVGGMIAHVYTPLIARQRLRIELRTDRKLWGTVLWTRDGTAGIGFDTQLNIDEMLARDGIESNHRRGAGPRLNIDCAAKLRVGARYYGVRVIDLGQGGVGILTTAEVEDGQEVVVTMEGFRPVPGVVLWSGDGRVGIAFNKAIPFDELSNWLQEMFEGPNIEINRGRR